MLLINSLQSSTLSRRLRQLVDVTSTYLRVNNIGFHQDRSGSVDLSFPNNSSVNAEVGADFLQNRDLEINTLTEKIANLIARLDDLETNGLGLDVSQMRVHEYINTAAELQRALNENIHHE
jgi:hypothetical protein